MPRRGRSGRNRKSKKQPEWDSYTETVSHTNDCNSLYKFMKDKNFCPTFLKPAIFKETGRGLMTLKPLKAGDVVMSLPESLLITSSTIANSRIGPHLTSCIISPLTMEEALTSFLISETLLGPQSDWSVYINNLPATVDLPLMYSRKEIRLLTDHAKLKHREIKSRLAASRKKITATLSRMSRVIGGTISHDLVTWAWSIVNTRCLYKEPSPHHVCWLDAKGDDCVLSVFFDFLNHLPTAKDTCYFNEETKTYDMITHQDYPAGSQLFICYGPHDNTDLLMEYGFTVPNNIHNFVEFSLDSIEGIAKRFLISNIDEKFKIIRQQFGALTCGPDSIHYNLLVAVRILALNSTQLCNWRELLSGEALSEKSEDLVTRLLSQIFNQRLLDNRNGQDEVKANATPHKQLILSLWQDEEFILRQALKMISEES